MFWKVIALIILLAEVARIIQNQVRLNAIAKDFDDVKPEDFEQQREFYRLANEWLERELIEETIERR